MTSSKAQFRAYEPAEVRNSRGGASNLHAELLEAHDALAASPVAGNRGPSSRVASLRRGTPGRQTWSGFTRDDASAVTDKSQSASGSQAYGQRYRPPYARDRPIPEQKFLANSTYREDNDVMQAARHSYFPYRDEFAPRSKRLLYEMALAQCSRDSVKSASSCAGTESCFTVASKAKNGVGSSAVGSSHGRSASAPSLVDPPKSADSQRIPGGIGSLARRRKDAQLRAPTQWAPDAVWISEKLETEGPAGLHTHNVPPKLHKNSLRQFGEHMQVVQSMMPWSEEPGVGNMGAGMK